MRAWVRRYLDDALVLLGCACILYGLAQWCLVVTWIVAGIMLAGFGVLIGKAKTRVD